MTPREINQSIESMRIYMSSWERIEHWVNFFVLLIPLGFIGKITIYMPLANDEFPSYGIAVFLAFLLFLRHKLVGPKMDAYTSNLTAEQFQKANHAAAILNDWMVLSNRKDYFTAIKGVGWQWEGIKITAIHKNGITYLNSMVNPAISSNPFTFGMVKKNKVELIRQYQFILNGENVVDLAEKEIEKREVEFWDESEWNVKNLLKRIIGYVLSVPFMGLGIWLIVSGDWKGIGIGIVIVWLCSSYIYHDIMIIREKRKRRRSCYNRG